MEVDEGQQRGAKRPTEEAGRFGAPSSGVAASAAAPATRGEDSGVRSASRGKKPSSAAAVAEQVRKESAKCVAQMEQQGAPPWVITMQQFFGGQQLEVRTLLAEHGDKLAEHDEAIAELRDFPGDHAPTP